MKLSRGDQRQDGKIFWHYRSNKTEYWVTPEQFSQLKSATITRPNKSEKEKKSAVEKKREREKIRYHQNKESESKRKSEYYAKNKSKIIERNKKYDQENREKVNERKRKYQHNRRKTNPKYAISCRLRGRFNSALRRRGYTKKSLVYKMIGCDWKTLKKHIESKFKNGMGWDVFHKIHIDHIIPLASAKTESEIAELFHYKNLQPLWSTDNMKKGAKL